MQFGVFVAVNNAVGLSSCERGSLMQTYLSRPFTYAS